jgi:hypothetical protein
MLRLTVFGTPRAAIQVGAGCGRPAGPFFVTNDGVLRIVFGANERLGSGGANHPG